MAAPSAASGTLTVSGSDDHRTTPPTSEGGGIYSVGNLSLSNGSAISGNPAQSGGGIWNSGSLDLSDVTIANNSAAKTGGGVYNISGSAAVTGGTISGNKAAAPAAAASSSRQR